MFIILFPLGVWCCVCAVADVMKDPGALKLRLPGNSVNSALPQVS